MKKLLPLILLFVMGSFAARATDLIVEEYGLTPTYSSIAAAVAAAVDGDRIIIKNRAGAIPWVEDIAITKSLDFLPFINDSFFIVQGNYTFTPGTSKSLTIVGMVNTSGNIVCSGTPTGNRTTVRILGSQLISGSIAVNLDNYDVTISGNRLSNGAITYRHGSIIGNEINSSGNSITVNSEAAVTNDTSFIIGNKAISSSSLGSGITWNSTSMNFDIRNNFAYAGQYGINIANSRATTTTLNKIYNNSIGAYYTGTNIYGLMVTTGSNTVVELMNNIVDKNNTSTSYTSYGIYASPGTGSQINAYFNFTDNAFTYQNYGTFTATGSNTIVNLTVNSTTGVSTSGIDQGNPATIFYDLDLTRNDVGLFGGSFTQNNFFPLFTGSTRTWMTAYPFNVRTGNTLSVKGTSFDR